MKYDYIDGNTILSEYDSFSIADTLECGQCFRYSKINDKYYTVIAFGKVLRVKERDDSIIFYNTTTEEFKIIWEKYFDLNRDYNNIKNNISLNDEVIQKSVGFAPGIRILNQDFFECLISFIISQNRKIPMIMATIKNISKRYGQYLGNIEGEDYYSFPTVNELFNATEEELMECKAGFRAKYIVDAVKKVYEGIVDFNRFKNMETEKVRENLMEIKGVGPKVADCVLLFSCGRGEVFPTDVWVKRIMAYFYFDNRETAIKEIHLKAEKSYGQYAGFAQQYLFYYARTLKIGSK